MERQELSPHDETILFQLIEIERSLPREDQSRRFQVKIFERPGKAPDALIQASTTSREFMLKSDKECFGELGAAGYISGGGVSYSIPEGNTTVLSLHTVQLLESAFDYYDEKHDFPTSLADEKREFVDSKISTHYPEVVSYLKKAYDSIWVDQPEGDWSSVAHDCQGALRSLASVMYKPDYASTLGEELPSSSNFVRKLEQIIRVNTDDEELRGLLTKLHHYANARRHDRGTTKEEAKRCVLYTYLILSEIYELIQVTE